MIRRALFAGFATLLTFIAWVTTVVAPAAIAATHPAGLLVSSDGTTWAAELGTPLFDTTDLWVPGESRTSTFYVRNLGDSPAAVRLAVLAAEADDLVGSGALVFQARVGGEAWRPVLRELADSPLNVLAVPVSAARRIDVRAIFRGGARNSTQASEVALRFVVQLAESLVPPPTAGLPATGAPDLRLPLLLAACCLATGGALVRRRRAVPGRGWRDG